MSEKEKLTIQKIHWDMIKQGYPYLEVDDNNDGWVYGLEYAIDDDDREHNWWKRGKERDEELRKCVESGKYTEIKEPFMVNPLVTSLIEREIERGNI